MRVSPYDCDCNHDPTPHQARISAAPRHRRKKREKNVEKRRILASQTETTKRFVKKTPTATDSFSSLRLHSVYYPTASDLALHGRFRTACISWRTRNTAAWGEELGSGVGLTGAIQVSFDTSYGKECLTWLIGLAVYITLRADKDNTLPFGALGLRKTATLRAPSLNAEENNPSYSSYLLMQQILNPARSSLLDEVYQPLPLSVANHNSLPPDRASNRPKILHWFLPNRLRPTPQQRHQQATCSLTTRQCISDQRGLGRRWRGPSR
jgi:hypothetical protein